MREIKFRAWDSEAECFVYSDQQYDDYFFEFVNGVLVGFSVDVVPATSSEPPDLESRELKPVMQYTGLSDRNGKEIYEGDVVRCAIKGGNTYIGPIKYFQDFGIFGVAMCKPFKYLSADANRPLGSSGSSTTYKAYNWHSYKSIEVIGNIYENPELADGVKK